MSSAMKNFVHYFEGVVGDVNRLHERFPFFTAGMIWVFPWNLIKEGKHRNHEILQKLKKHSDLLQIE